MQPLTRPLVAVLPVGLDDDGVFPLAEGVLLHLWIQLVAPPGTQWRQKESLATSAPTTAACKRARGAASAALLQTHLSRQLLPDRPLMPFAMMDQFLGPYSAISWRNSSSSCAEMVGNGVARWCQETDPRAPQLPSRRAATSPPPPAHLCCPGTLFEVILRPPHGSRALQRRLASGGTGRLWKGETPPLSP